MKKSLKNTGLVPTVQPEPDLSKTGVKCFVYYEYELQNVLTTETSDMGKNL